MTASLEAILSGFLTEEGRLNYLSRLPVKSKVVIPDGKVAEVLSFLDSNERWEDAALFAAAVNRTEDVVKFFCFEGKVLDAAKVSEKLGAVELAVECYQHAKRPIEAFNLAVKNNMFSEALRVVLRNPNLAANKYVSSLQSFFEFIGPSSRLETGNDLGSKVINLAKNRASEEAAVGQFVPRDAYYGCLARIVNGFVAACSELGLYSLGLSIAEKVECVDLETKNLLSSSFLAKGDAVVDLKLEQKYAKKDKRPKPKRRDLSVPFVYKPSSSPPVIPNPKKDSDNYRRAASLEKQADSLAKTDVLGAKALYEQAAKFYVAADGFESAGRIVRFRLNKPLEAMELYERGVILNELAAECAEEAGLLEKAMILIESLGRYYKCAELADKLGKQELAKDYWRREMEQDLRHGNICSASLSARKACLESKADELADLAVVLEEEVGNHKGAGAVSLKVNLFDRALVNYEKAGMFCAASRAARMGGDRLADRAKFYDSVVQVLGYDDHL